MMPALRRQHKKRTGSLRQALATWQDLVLKKAKPGPILRCRAIGN